MPETREIFVKVPAEGYEQLKELAESEHRTLSDFVRLALEESAARKGKPIPLSVRRGGDQGGRHPNTGKGKAK